MLLSRIVGALREAVPSKSKGVVGLTNEALLSSALLTFKDTDSVDFLWLDCEGLHDAPKAFWEMYKAKALAPSCHVVFTSIHTQKPGLIRAWQEFTQQYTGTVFGDMYLFRYTNLVKPQMMSCMRGILQ